MKKHAIIPIFIPHLGCPHDCIFCNQRKITARLQAVSPEDVRNTIDTWLTTLGGVETVETAFYGGSFTGIPIEDQTAYLEIAREYKDAGRISKIHLSTRPDYINREILDNLAAHGVDTIELGVQSFDDRVLRLAGRGHDSSVVYRSAELIKEYGFELGIQLMIGLPGDSMESCIYSALETAAIGPELARLYPTVILDDTGLLELYRRGEYIPLTEEEAVERTKEMYKILRNAGITIMRVGLKSTDVITDGDKGAANAGTYHPAFRQLVEGRIAREEIEALIEQSPAGSNAGRPAGNEGCRTACMRLTVYSSPAWFSNMVGHKGVNRNYFAERYPWIRFRFAVDPKLEDGKMKIDGFSQMKQGACD